MVTKGIILSIDRLGNTCTVRMPVFESSAGGSQMVATATFANTPGCFNGYLENDVVIVAFENNKLSEPIVIGKLYLGAVKEQSSARGSVNCVNLTTKVKSSISIDTEITTDVSDEKGIISNKPEVANNTFKNLRQLMNQVAENTKQLDTGFNNFSKTSQQIGFWLNNKPLYRVTWELTPTISSGVLAQQLDIAELNCKEAWVDLTHTVIIKSNQQSYNPFGNPSSSTSFNIDIDLAAKKINLTGKGLVDFDKLYVTIEYTKKDA